MGLYGGADVEVIIMIIIVRVPLPTLGLGDTSLDKSVHDIETYGVDIFHRAGTSVVEFGTKD